MSRDHENTVFLPKTPFAMKANLAKREKDFLAFWDRIDLFKALREDSAAREKFILHFGPPYANGHLHIGHALSYIAKDIINKLHQMAGFDAPLVPGWDCHGLPTELKVEENYAKRGLKKEDAPVGEYIQACRDFASEWIAVQKSEMKRFGLIADFANPYVTMDFASEAKIVGELYKFLKNGGLYRDLKPVLWSVVEKTALAEAEVEYKDRVGEEIYVGFKIVKTKIEALKDAFAAIWTTTPWTLPGNRAIAYGGDHVYSAIEVLEGNDLVPEGMKLLMAKSLTKTVTLALGGALTRIYLDDIKGEELYGTVCEHPFKGEGYDFEVPLLPASHVTLEIGTGLVHTAPAHGAEDFAVAKEFGLEIPETVQADGTYAANVPLFAGRHIFKIAPAIVEELKKTGNLLKSGEFSHSYPHSWRSKTPLIYRATSQWFVSMEKNDLRKKALEAIEKVEWFPPQGKNRISAMVGNRPDWCLSRQRIWGVPIAIFVDKRTREPLVDEEVFKRVTSAIEKEGIAAWRERDDAFFLGTSRDPADYEKVTDILDVWFESACTNAFALRERPELRWPADMYFEGSDQHRGWFQTSLLHACGTMGEPPYREVLTHGFVLDEKGRKMSKSSGNVVSPNDVIDAKGADILRLWVACSDYTDDTRVGNEILKHIEDIYRRLRNTLRYLLGVADYFAELPEIPYDSMPDPEKWVLLRLKELERERSKISEDHDFAAFYNELHAFCANDLSAFYFDIRKDRLYCDDSRSPERQATLTVMREVFERIAKWLAPVLSFTAEEAWHVFKKVDATTLTDPVSVHLETFAEAPSVWENPELAERMEELRQIRKVATGALELARASKTIGSGLQAEVIVYVDVDDEKWNRLNKVDWAEFVIASQAKITRETAPTKAFALDEVKGVGVIVERAKGAKCGRCWKVLPEVGALPDKNLCARCDAVVANAP